MSRLSRLLPLLAALALAQAGCRFSTSRSLGAGDLRGRIVVVDDAGVVAPVDGAIVQLEGSGFTVKSDARGRFALRGIPAGTWSVRIRKSVASGDLGLRLRHLELSSLGTSSGGRDLGDLRIGGLGTWSGTLKRGTDPVVRGRVVLGGEREDVSAEGGRFSFDRLLPGTYDIAAIDPANGAVSVATPVEIPLGGTVTSDVDLGALTAVTTGDVSGIALLSGQNSHDGIRVRLPGAVEGELFTTADGFFQAPSLPAGVYTLIAEAEGYRPVQLPFVVVAGETVIEPLALLAADATCDNAGAPVDPLDADADGTPDADEPAACLCAPGSTDVDDDALCDHADPDRDNDGHDDVVDNCPLDANEGQADSDEDGIGDACDTVEASCFDDVQNGDETGVDCGGTCSACPTCFDDEQNGDETGLDCGGSCEPCAGCFDEVQNGDETGVDCGGSCSPCASALTFCAAGGACIDFPRSTANLAIDALEAVPGTPVVFAIGAGHVLRQAGLTWVPELAPATGAFTALHAETFDFAVAAGEGVVATWDGTGWTPHPAIPPGHVYDTLGTSRDDLRFATNDGLFHWNGTALVSEQPPSSGTIRWLASGNGQRWAASEQELLRYDGAGWVVAETLPFYSRLSALHVANTGAADYAVFTAGPTGGSNAQVYRRTPTGSAVAQGGELPFEVLDLSRRPGGVSEGALYALVAMNGVLQVLLYNFSGWEAVGAPVPPGGALGTALFAERSPGAFTIAESGGVLSNVDATTQATNDGFDPLFVRSLSGSNASNVWLLEESTALRRFDGTSWRRIPPPVGRVVDVRAVGVDQAWVVLSDWRITRWEGSDWSAPESVRPVAATGSECLSINAPPEPRTLASVGSEVVLVGGSYEVRAAQTGCVTKPVVMMRSGSGVTQSDIPFPSSTELRAIAGGESNTWLFGPDGDTCRPNGTGGYSCSVAEMLVNGVLSGVATEVGAWVVGGTGGLWRSTTGASWIDETPEGLGFRSFTDIQTFNRGSTDNVLAVGTRGLVATSTGGAAPSLLATPFIHDLATVWGTGLDAFRAGGNGLFRYDAGLWTLESTSYVSLRASRLAVAGPGRLVASTLNGQTLSRNPVNGEWSPSTGLPRYAVLDVATDGTTDWALDTSMGALFRFVDGLWQPLDEGGALVSGRDLLLGVIDGLPVVRTFEGAQRWNGSAWSSVECGLQEFQANDASFRPDGQGFLVGGAGYICRRTIDGSLVEESVPGGSGPWFRHVSTRTGTEAWAVSFDLEFFQRTSAGWSAAVTTGLETAGGALDLHVTLDGTLFLATDNTGGESATIPGKLFKLRPGTTAWELVAAPLGVPIRRLAGTGNQVWGVNDHGAIVLVEDRPTGT